MEELYALDKWGYNAVLSVCSSTQLGCWACWRQCGEKQAHNAALSSTGCSSTNCCLEEGHWYG